MYDQSIHSKINQHLKGAAMNIAGGDNPFYTRFIANAKNIYSLYMDIYIHHPRGAELFDKLVNMITAAYINRPAACKAADMVKEQKGQWFLSNDITGMSLYVDRFCGNIKGLGGKLGYFKKLGVNLLHLMPVFESPAGESDGGYAVSNFRKVDARFGTLDDLKEAKQKMNAEGLSLMIDIVLNHTSQRHEWAEKAKAGDVYYQDFFYMFSNRDLPDRYDATMPEIFPESSRGNFTWVPECNKWVMTVFHNYQWDLNYTNPDVFAAMLENIFFYANLGVDILRIDAPAFIWKQLGTTCQNLPQAHTLLRLIKLCVQVAAPGMALLGEAIVAPREIMNYFGTGIYTAHECDFAYNATHMALQWDALATGDTRVMLAAQHEILKKPLGTSWITYTRCHDDIGLGYEDYMISQAGFSPYEHRRFLKEYYSGSYDGSPATGALFSYNPKTQDARISGSLASLCGLEKAINDNDEPAKELAIRKIMLMQAHSLFLGGVPMLFYGDEAGYTNDYSYLTDPGKSYDNRWMHRPVIDWVKNENINLEGTVEHRIFAATQRLITIRRKLPVVADHKNLHWLITNNLHVAGYLRNSPGRNLYCIFNFSSQHTQLQWSSFGIGNAEPVHLYDHWSKQHINIGQPGEYLAIGPYCFYLLEENKPKAL